MKKQHWDCTCGPNGKR